MKRAKPLKVNSSMPDSSLNTLSEMSPRELKAIEIPSKEASIEKLSDRIEPKSINSSPKLKELTTLKKESKNPGILSVKKGKKAIS